MRTLVEPVRSSAITWLANLELLAGTTKEGTGYTPSWEESGVPVFTLMGSEESADWQA